MADLDFTGKAVLVTGAARGLGKQIAKAFHARGAQVTLNDLKGEAIAAAITDLGDGSRLTAAEADISTAAGCEHAVALALERFGRLDVLVNNAAINWEMPIAGHTEEIWDKHVDTILKGSFFCAKAAIPALKASRGCIVNIASELGLHPIVNNVAYCAAKGGVVNLTRALAIELAPDIRVNCVCPGAVDTEMLQEVGRALGDGDVAAGYAKLTQNRPMQRVAKAAEIANAILWLASDLASFTTGAIQVVDGGVMAKAG
jgi:NAD(P)-dependent dehydrogenase (short-subunit alcohol dehydrogenase family)